MRQTQALFSLLFLLQGLPVHAQIRHDHYITFEDTTMIEAVNHVGIKRDGPNLRAPVFSAFGSKTYELVGKQVAYSVNDTEFDCAGFRSRQIASDSYMADGTLAFHADDMLPWIKPAPRSPAGLAITFVCKDDATDATPFLYGEPELYQKYIHDLQTMYRKRPAHHRK